MLAAGLDGSHFYQCPYELVNSTLAEILEPALVKVSTPYLLVFNGDSCNLPCIKLWEDIPNLLARHEKVHASLGPGYSLGGAPFCMTVINIQPATTGHRDNSDMINSICLVLALGEFKGAALCLYEPGVVVELPHGSFVAI